VNTNTNATTNVSRIADIADGLITSYSEASDTAKGAVKWRATGHANGACDARSFCLAWEGSLTELESAVRARIEWTEREYPLAPGATAKDKADYAGYSSGWHDVADIVRYVVKG